MASPVALATPRRPTIRPTDFFFGAYTTSIPASRRTDRPPHLAVTVTRIDTLFLASPPGGTLNMESRNFRLDYASLTSRFGWRRTVVSALSDFQLWPQALQRVMSELPSFSTPPASTDTQILLHMDVHQMAEEEEEEEPQVPTVRSLKRELGALEPEIAKRKKVGAA